MSDLILVPDDAEFIAAFDARHITEWVEENRDPDTGNIVPPTKTRAASSTVRDWWSSYICHPDDRFVNGQMFGNIGAVPALLAPAYEAMEQALRDTGYTPTSTWAYNCRNIAGTKVKSLHSAGIAIDIDPALNPFSVGDPYSGALQAEQVEAIKSIVTTDGERQVFTWGGDWSRSKDRMHFQCDVPPQALEQGVTYDGGATIPKPPPTGEIIMQISRVQVSAKQNQKHPDVRIAQSLLAGFSPTSPGSIDGIAGAKFDASAKAFQKKAGLVADGIVGAKTWSRLEDAD